MRWKGIQCLGLLFLSCLSARADEATDLSSLKTENELLRRERDALDARLRITQDQLEEARKSAVAARLEVEGLDFRLKKLQDDFKLLKSTLPPLNQLPVATSIPAKTGRDPAKQETARGKITEIAVDGRLMQISIGLEAGLKNGQALDVYRLGTDKGKLVPLYLGTIRLTRVDPLASIGQYERVPGLDRNPRIGDEVSNELIVK